MKEMAKKMAHVVGGQILKKRMMKKKKKTIHKVIDYLLSDSYLFAPIVSPSPFISFPSPTKDIQIRERIKDKRSLVNKLQDYFKCDCYMYAPLVAPTASTGYVGYVKKISTAENLMMKEKRICTSGNFVEVEATVLDQTNFSPSQFSGVGMSDPKRRKIVVN